ncbi:hypothetical protein Q5P01_011614 [Channa striata]|uniref:Pyrin domain-containing protein n=1 Tax=Channa striata TaxID=64152 RepID=A0AA88MX93_CHASR|nr:hypothetical protein Q5P01_011614 [Channa striata]
MARATITRFIMEALEDLSKKNLDKFCFQLRDRREEPRITELLVSTFTETRALQVTLDTLRLINCNEEAKKLGKTKALPLNKRHLTNKSSLGDPSFRKTSDGDFKPSQEALTYAARRGPLKAARCSKKPEEVEADAQARVLSEARDPYNNRLVLSRCTIQFGQYKGQSFKWLLENDMSYAAMLVAEHQKVQQHTTSQDPLMVNKDYLTRYATAYPEVLKEVTFYREYLRAKERSRYPGQAGKALVGFGRHRSMTLEDLYESNELTSYVDFLRSKKSTCKPASRMEDAVKYILQRDRKKAARKLRRNWTRTHFSSLSRY